MWVVRYGATDMKGILQSAKKKDYLMHVVYLVESSINRVRNDPERYKRSADAVVQSIIIFDMDGFSMRHITYKPGIWKCLVNLRFNVDGITTRQPWRHDSRLLFCVLQVE